MTKNRLCIICKKPLNYRQKIVCSHKCLGIYQSQIGKVTFTCPICGKTKIINKHLYKMGQRTCSPLCGKKLFYSTKNSIKKIFTCDYCQKEFYTYPSVRRGKLSFCNRKCHYNWLTKTHSRAGKNNPAWKGGKYNYNRWGSRYLFESNKDLKKIILSRDKNHCLSCKEFTKYPRIHHADFNGKNNSLNNLVTLCPSCHRRIEELRLPTAHLIVNVL